MMRKYDYIEDYLEVIAGLRDPATLKPSGLIWFNPIINLARYDVPVINTMSDRTFNGGALTERQGELAVQLVSKYRRQLMALGIDSESTNKFRKPFRILDDRKDIYISDDEIRIRFPYNKILIEEIKTFAEQSHGRCYWNRDERVWQSALTEYNLSWLVSWGEKNNFSFDATVRDMFEKIRQVERKGFSVTLMVKDGLVSIKNANDNLIDYIDQHMGGVSKENLLALVDYSAILGYDVDASVYEHIDIDLSNEIRQLLIEKQLIEDKKNMALLKEYATITKRFPIVIYEPDLTNELLASARQHFGEKEIQVLGARSTKNAEIDPSCLVVHTLKPLTHIDIQLLVSSAGLIAGGDRQMMLQRSEKVVYSTPAVYNNKKRNTVKHL